MKYFLKLDDMTQEEKKLLLKDICARLPYGVKVLDNSHKNYGISKLINIGVDGSMLVDNEINDIQYYPIIDEIKPYLRSLSLMTEEEIKECYRLQQDTIHVTFDEYDEEYEKTIDLPYFESLVDFYNYHYLDYHGLIPKGLALEALPGMYK